MSDVEGLAGVLRAHIPNDRYGPDGENVGTFCTCGTWEGDYFADGEAGPFDDHLAAMLAPVVQAARAEALGDVLARIKTHNDGPITPKALRWAATHEALCRSWIFDVLTGLADEAESAAALRADDAGGE